MSSRVDVADVEVFHLGGLRGEVGEVRPDFPKVIGPKRLPGYGVPSRPLDVHTLRDGHRALAIGPLPDLGDLDVDGFSKLALPAKMVDCFLNCCHAQTLPSINSKCQQLSSIVASVTSKTDFSDIRHQKLKEMLATRFGGVQSEFAKAIGKNPTQVNHWFSRHRNPNGDTCREVEQSLKLPSGWLDDQPVKVPDAELKELSDMLAAMQPQERADMLEYFIWHIQKFGPGVVRTVRPAQLPFSPIPAVAPKRKTA